MSKRQSSHPGLSEIAEYNRGLEATLARRSKMTLGLYKLIESLAELAAVFLGFYAISQGADPLLTFMAVAVIVGGWLQPHESSSETVGRKCRTDLNRASTSREFV